ncbi:MAG: FxsA family protein [Mycobacteriaceae bacterium]
MPLLIPLAWLVVEVVLLLLVGSWLGVGWTLLALLGTSVLGGVLLRNQGRRTVAALREAQARNRSGGRELADGALGGVGALLLVLPGFGTDLLGVLLVLPPTRALVRPLLAASLGRRMPLVGAAGGRNRPQGHEVIEGEVVPTDEGAAQPRLRPPPPGHEQP